MSGHRVVKRYARALLEVASESGKTDEIVQDLENIEKIVGSAPEIRRYCLGIHPNRRQELEFVRTAFVPYVTDLTGRMLTELAANGRLAAVPFLDKAAEEILDKWANRITVLVESASSLERETLDRIRVRMARRTGKKVTVSQETVPGLMGGFRISWNNRTIDMSVRGRLNRFRNLMT